MDLWTDISTNAWLIAFMLISLIIPVTLGLGVIRLFGGSVKKTVKTFTRRS